MNTIGSELRLTLFGASHGPCVGAVLDGVPPGMMIDVGRIQSELDLRRPKAGIGTPRAEEDKAVAVGGKEAEAQVVAVRREAKVVALVAAVQEEARDEISHSAFFTYFPPMGFGRGFR